MALCRFYDCFYLNITQLVTCGARGLIMGPSRKAGDVDNVSSGREGTGCL